MSAMISDLQGTWMIRAVEAFGAERPRSPGDTTAVASLSYFPSADKEDNPLQTETPPTFLCRLGEGARAVQQCTDEHGYIMQEIEPGAEARAQLIITADMQITKNIPFSLIIEG